MSLTLLSFQKWAIKCAGMLIFAINFFIFLLFDLFETILCVIYRFLDELFEGESSSCYCHNREKWGRNVGDGEDSKVSETLYGRKNVFRQMGFLGIPRKLEDFKKIGGGGMGMRWSDCGCEACVDWMKDGGQRLHVVVRQPSRATEEDCSGKPTENVIFLHGFLSSSLFWTETVFPNLSETSKCNYRLFAVDVLGFGRSPKPRDCLYTISDHLDMIENSVIDPFELTSFHLVAHSMGCVIALALAAKYSNIVKSITLVAPPYFPCSREEASSIALERLAGKALWPPLLFGSSFMTRYEHLGRCVCFLVCRNHRLWERILKLLTRRRDLHFIVVDLTRHTHHSAWHNMHNVICGGAKFMDNYLETLANSKVKIWVVQGTRDQVVPIECSNNIKMKVPDSEVDHIANADHGTVIFGREKDFTDKLEHLWQRAVAA
ncbi:probable lysophospholipase BODYGUARD 4 isoform X1 [Tripterygium wilfordii]|uniref:probable lysophospholipase BODYGUARD 4 isoform X1 n=1 Tax=Tripterygium wilfordii TaxID=458696 RepID=UPI0018F7FA32|nr:probable lysophospholipase BODYGUARD 4 isoform X1 [Tripterygium wilfordii]